MKRTYIEPSCEEVAVQTAGTVLVESELRSGSFGETGIIDDKSGEAWW